MRFVELLAGPAIEWGLIGPRERDRLWQRHVLNCAAVADLLPAGARVVDVGSGAGLPGLVLGCMRGDLCIDLVEPLERRVRFLQMAVSELGLADRVRVVRGRAEQPGTRTTVAPVAWCTARAVAPLDRLMRWCLPLLGPGGRLLAMKGATAEDEVRSALPALRRVRATAEVRVLKPDGLDEAVRVVVVTRGGER